MGFSRPSRAASTALSRETASQGWATAVAIGGCLLATSIRRSYLACERTAGGDVRHGRPSAAGRPLRRRTALRCGPGAAGLPPAGRRARRAPAAGRRARPGAACSLSGSSRGMARTARSSSRRTRRYCSFRQAFSSAMLMRSFAGCMARIACSGGEAAFVDAALGHADIDQGAQHGLRQAADLEASLELDPHLGLVGLAHELAVDPPLGRRMLGAQPDHGLQQRRAVDAEEHRLGHGVARLPVAFPPGRDPGRGDLLEREQRIVGRDRLASPRARTRPAPSPAASSGSCRRTW